MASENLKVWIQPKETVCNKHPFVKVRILTRMLNHVALPFYNKDGVKEKNKPEIFLFIPYILRPHQKLSPTLPSKLVASSLTQGWGTVCQHVLGLKWSSWKSSLQIPCLKANPTAHCASYRSILLMHNALCTHDVKMRGVWKMSKVWDHFKLKLSKNTVSTHTSRHQCLCYTLGLKMMDFQWAGM